MQVISHVVAVSNYQAAIRGLEKKSCTKYSVVFIGKPLWPPMFEQKIHTRQSDPITEV